MLRKTLLVCSLFFISSCGLKHPKGFICLYDEPRQRSLCYDMEKDINENGEVKKDAKLTIIENVTLKSLDKHTHFDPESWSNVRKWMKQARDRVKDCQ
jgi:hypothetical protein